MVTHNERNTENIVREELRRLGYFDAASAILVEEQKSQIDGVKKLLKSASKSGAGGFGSPEFIVSCAAPGDFLVIVECKADVKDHISKRCEQGLRDDESVSMETDDSIWKRTQKFAVDGLLHYASRLSKSFNVIGIAISGETKEAARISTYIHVKGESRPTFLTTKDGRRIEQLIAWHEYIEHGTFDPRIQRLRSDELMAFSRDLHEFMRDYAKLTEGEKPLLVSGTLIALNNHAFSKSFSEYTPAELPDEWLSVISKEVHKADIPKAKKDKMVQPYSNIAAHPELGKSTKVFPKGILHELIQRVNEKVWPFISVYHDFDVVGQFYGEFLRYSGGDKKSLGIVLTPRHITELFSLLANVDASSRVLDLCAGTGGFLISAMHQMMKTAVTAEDRDRICREGLVGVEQQPSMYALAASNMILRGDGKANLYQGSCFEEEIISAVKDHQCTIGMLNPPFSQGEPELHELRFIKQMLECLVKGSIGIALAPMSCAIATHPLRHELLRNHTLEAVMSVPETLFSPAQVVCCAMVFTAHVPHEISNKKTWFGYWRDDGFTPAKHLGRIDAKGKWTTIRDRWVELFRNREVCPGESVSRRVTADDEWCAEAYMETDYSKLTREVFEAVFQNHVLHLLMGRSNQRGEEMNEV